MERDKKKETGSGLAWVRVEFMSEDYFGQRTQTE